MFIRRVKNVHFSSAFRQVCKSDSRLRCVNGIKNNERELSFSSGSVTWQIRNIDIDYS